MFESEITPLKAPDVLSFLTEIEQRASRHHEILLRDSAAPWAALLADYVEKLTALMSDAQDSRVPAELYGLDAGHAGGCG
ncbi:DUF6269 family protein [Streptomyces sp. NPDC098789]|uniref:DUF6269 family protein n=1 Tax=Streptomyces sp. NPDC098789 TaxID=3366098 RepID=UPI0038242889